jgi:hypothetical protein
VPSIDRPHRCGSLWAVPTRERGGCLGGLALPTRECQHVASMCPKSGPLKHAPDESPRPEVVQLPQARRLGLHLSSIFRSLRVLARAVTTTHLRRLEGQEDRGWEKVAYAIGLPCASA